MLSLDRCRSLLDADRQLADTDIERIRDNARTLAQVALAVATSRVEAAKEFQNALALMPEEDRVEVEERAAILEFDAHIDRKRAEAAALAVYQKRKP